MYVPLEQLQFHLLQKKLPMLVVEHLKNNTVLKSSDNK